MKVKKMLCLLLAAVMIAGLFPATVLAAPADDGEMLGTTTEGTFTDTTADPAKSYEYTIKGSDGSERKATVYGAGGESTGNTINEITVSGGIYYQKVADPVHFNGTCLLVAEGNYAVNHTPATTAVTVTGDRINGEKPDCEWTVTASETNRLKFSTGTDTLYISSESWPYNVEVSPGGDSKYFQAAETDGTIKLSQEVGGNDVFLKVNDKDIDGSRYSSTSFSLYEKKIEAGGTQYNVNTAGLDALLNDETIETEEFYTASSWKAYDTAKSSAVDAKKALHNPYKTSEEANAALVAIDEVHRNLKNAMDQLSQKESVAIADMTWQRTLEYASGEPNAGDLVTGMSFLSGEAPLYPVIAWDWTKIRGLTTDDSMTVWDYNMDAQYSAAPKVPGITAATWNDRSATGDIDGDYTTASVRRFTGTFTWPDGFGMDSTASIVSVNDANYKDIYDHINGNAKLKERFGKSRVMPVNDDIYVFISKSTEDPTQWSEEEAHSHLMFWTGTSGKGIWSDKNNKGDDWGRETPAICLGTPAVPAYHAVYPNMGDIPSETTHPLPQGCSDAKLKHTDGWYTLIDSNVMMSTLKNLYGAAADLSGQKMNIDIYAFDNDTNGGMDQMKLTLIKPEEQQVQVAVNYWLDNDNGTSLGTTFMTAAVGDHINLLEGTNINELNHKKGDAIIKAGEDTNVSDGVQQELNYEVKAGISNEINVVYTRDVKGITYFTYDFGIENKYLYTDTNAEGIKEVSLERATHSAEIRAEFEGHNIWLTYKPKDALTIPEEAKLVVKRIGGSENKYKISFIPASNVLYEEDFMTTEGTEFTPWTKSGSCPAGPVTDNYIFIPSSDENGESVFGYTQTYRDQIGESGAYSAVLTADGNAQFSNDLKFSFRGVGFDLIGTCGKDTGTLLVKVRDFGNAAFEKNYIIDTSFTDSAVAENIYQVPLLHCTELPTGARYDVTVCGANINYKTPVKARGSNWSSDPALYEAMTELGLSDEQIKNAEYIGMDDSVADGFRPVRQPDPLQTGDKTVSVDGFRVYRKSDNSIYPVNEQNITYTNVMKDDIGGNFVCYLEPNDFDKPQPEVYGVADYEKYGGPENEVYLKPGTGLSFHITNVKNGTVQVSVRAVTGQTQMEVNENGTPTIINHNTEMYYEVPVVNGIVTIANTSTGSGSSPLLAICNVKAEISEMSNVQKVEAAKRMAAMMKPAPAELPWVNPFRDVKEEDFFYEPVKWASRLGVTNGVTKDTFCPLEGCTRAEAVTFLWRAFGKPEAGPVKMRFTDISKDEYYYDAMLWALDKKVALGVTETTFCPDDVCTRAQIATFLWRAFGYPDAAAEQMKFTDVPKEDYFYDAVLWAAESKIAWGVTPTAFCPDDTCTRGQIVTFLCRAMAEGKEN